MNLRIHSGGQTGADLAGLWVAKTLGLPTGGVAPLGYKTLNGPQPGLKDLFDLGQFGDYRSRTIKNVRDADATIIFSRKMSSPGTVLTRNACTKYTKPCFAVHDDRHQQESLKDYWGDLTDRHAEFLRAVKYLIEAGRQAKAKGLQDEYFILNVAGNATKNSPDAFGFAFVGMWMLVSMYDKVFNILSDDAKEVIKKDPFEIYPDLQDSYQERA